MFIPFFSFFPTDRPTFKRGRAMGNETFYWDGLSGTLPAFDTVLLHSHLSSLRPKYLSDVPTDKTVLSWGPKISKKPLKIRYWWLKIRKENFIFGLSRGDFWQPLIAPEAWKERSCQSFSASHIGPKATTRNLFPPWQLGSLSRDVLEPRTLTGSLCSCF